VRIDPALVSPILFHPILLILPPSPPPQRALHNPTIAAPLLQDRLASIVILKGDCEFTNTRTWPEAGSLKAEKEAEKETEGEKPKEEEAEQAKKTTVDISNSPSIKYCIANL
jgi:hypothetical protein